MKILARCLVGLAFTASLVSVPPGMDAAHAGGCSRLKDSTIKFGSSGKRTEQEVWYDKGQIHFGEKFTVRGPRRVTDIDLTVTACKDSDTGKWQTRRVSAQQYHADLEHELHDRSVTVTPHSGNHGWGVYGLRSKGRTLTAVGRICAEEPRKLRALWALRGVLKLPLPGSYQVSVGAFVLDKALPEAPEPTYHCANIGTTSLKWKFTRRGRAAHVSDVPRGVSVKRAYPCNRTSPSVDSCDNIIETSFRFTKR